MRPHNISFRHRHGSMPSGLSYVEVVVSITILAILTVAAMQLFGNLARSKSAVLGQNGGSYLAIEMIKEIMEKSYQDPNNADEFGIGLYEATDDRLLLDDIDDYHNWTQSPPQERNGDTINQYGHLTRSVQVRYVQADDFTQTAPADEGFKEITITISNSKTSVAQQVYVIADVALD